VIKMLYTLGDFASNLESELRSNKGLRDSNIQSDEALELLNELLPRNMMVKKIFVEKEDTESILDVKKR